jgi:hypothetical protein
VSSEHHDEEEGAHEIDKMPYARLFNLLVGLSVLTLLSCIGVIQIFNLQVRQITEEYALEGQKASMLTDYRADAAQVGGGYGRFEFELEGKAEERFFVPVQAAKKQVLDDPKLLQGIGSYRGWDDSPVGKQIKDWGGIPVPKAAEPRKRPGPEGAPEDGEAPGGKGDEGKGDEGKGDEGKAEDGKADDGKADDEGKAEDGKAPEGKADDGKGDDVKTDGGKADEGKAGRRRGATKAGEGEEGKTRRGKRAPQPSAAEAKADG